MSYSNGLLSDQSHQTANKYVQKKAYLVLVSN